jgi:hypothetical protein
VSVLRFAFVERLRRRFAAQRGFALVPAIGISLVLGIAGTTMIGYSTQNAGSASRSGADQVTYALAEAGVNNAMAVLENPANNPLDPALLPATTTAFNGGSVTWSGTLDRASAVWTVSATGQTRNPTGPKVAPIRRTTSAKVRVVQTVTQPLGNGAWQYIVATRIGNTCDMNVSSGVTQASPLYVVGNLCLSTGTRVTAGPLVVKGKLSLSNTDTAVGSSLVKINEAHLAGSCKYYVNAWHSPCSSADNVWANVLDQAIPPLTTPQPQWDTWYRNAIPGPFQSCTTVSGSPPVFENESVGATRNNSVAGAFSLTPAVSYACRVGPADSPSGELSWDASARMLTVIGTVFVDGSAKVDNGLVNSYRGQGALYLSGTLLLTGSSKLCARVSGADCDYAGWNPGANPSDPMLTIVANGNGGQVLSGDSIQLGSFSGFEGALYATNAIQFGSSSKVKGPMVGSTVILSSSVETYTFPLPTYVPTGIPGNNVVFAKPAPPQMFAG